MSSEIFNERSFLDGQRWALISMLKYCVRELGREDPLAQAANYIAERQTVVIALRDLCNKYGDNDWEDDLALEDVLRKHLQPYLEEAFEEDDQLKDE